MKVGKLLKKERLRQGLTQKDVARKLGVEQQNVHYWETKTVLNSNILEKYSNLLGIEIVLSVKDKE